VKKGFFSLLVMVLLSNFAYASTNTAETPQGDVEDFFNKVKAACEDPGSVGNQKPPENIMIKCEETQYLWHRDKDGDYVKLPQYGTLDVSIYCDKDLGSLEESFDLILPSVKVKCPKYTLYKTYTTVTHQGLTCPDIKDVDSIQEFCEESMDEGDPVITPTDMSVSFCPSGPGQKPPRPEPPSTQPVPQPEPPSTQPVPGTFTPNLNYWVQ